MLFYVLLLLNPNRFSNKISQILNNHFLKFRISPLFCTKSFSLKKLSLFGLILGFLAACQTPKGFDYRDVKNIKIEKLGYDMSTLSLELVYYNPNNFGVDLKKVDCDVYINSHYLGKYQLDTLMHIDNKSEFSLPSKMNVNMTDIFKNALTVFLSKEVLVTVKGNTKVGKSGIFITVPFNYEGRHRVELFN